MHCSYACSTYLESVDGSEQRSKNSYSIVQHTVFRQAQYLVLAVGLSSLFKDHVYLKGFLSLIRAQRVLFVCLSVCGDTAWTTPVD